MNLLTSSVAFTPKQEEGRFAEKYTFEQRVCQSSKIRDKYPEHVLVILEPAPKSRRKHIVVDDHQAGLKSKYLVPGEQSVGKFIATIRQQIKLSKEEALYILTGDNTIPASSMTMSQLDAQHRSSDGFLYLVFAGENTFGEVVDENK
jgi:GABA(A) receptor-associated protein